MGQALRFRLWVGLSVALSGCSASRSTSPSSAADGGGAGSGSLDAGPTFDDTRAPIARSMIAPETAPTISDADYATFIAHLDQFGLDLGQKMASDNQLTTGNLVYSPLSVSYALAMTYAGARGQTATEMKSVLGDSFDDGVFHRGANRLARELASRVTSRPDSDGYAHRLDWAFANSIFVDQSLALEPTFLDLLGSQYDSGVRQVDFISASETARSTINDWVADRTKGKVIDLLPMASINADVRLVLANALYFYGTWVTPFNPDFSLPAPFHRLDGVTIQAPIMVGSNIPGSYGIGADFEVAELPYEGDHMRMTIVLPATGRFESVRSQVSAAWLAQALSLLSPEEMTFRLPKFSFSSGTFSLKNALIELGMKTAFSGSADFSGISTGEALMLFDVLQKADVAVDENGTAAASATAVTAGANSKPRPVTVDRPFLFFIRDDGGAVLFSGQVVDPTQ